MCITSRPSTMSNTLIYSGNGFFNSKKVRVLAYQNIANSDLPNAMIIPFPSDVKMTSENIINTSSFKDFLKNIVDASKAKTLYFNSDTKSARRSFIRQPVSVFDIGSYTVVLAERAYQLKGSLEMVAEDKRPNISDYFIEDLNNLYPNSQIAICCWQGNIQAEPLLWFYESRNEEEIFIPTMDAHDGNAPNLNDKVTTDHIISIDKEFFNKNVFKDRIDGGYGAVKYTNDIPEKILDLLPKYVVGSRLPTIMKNGDIFVNSDRLTWKRGSFSSPSYEGGFHGW